MTAYARGDCVQIAVHDTPRLATLVDVDLARKRFKVSLPSGEQIWVSYSEIIRKV